MADTPRNHFIRVIEVWVPNAHGDRLIFDGGLYGDLDEFRKLSVDESFACGDGLPGKAWAEQLPVVLTEFTADNFHRTDAAHAASLTSGIAVPVFDGDQINAVVVYLCGQADAATGAIEVWCDDGLSELAMVDGYYGELERFEWISRRVRFPRGRGLPGEVWATGKAEVVADLGHTKSFLRARNAAEAGITTGFAMPVYSPRVKDDLSAVTVFLSSNDTPIARRFEIWERDDEGESMTFTSAVEHAKDAIEARNQRRTIAEGRGVIGEVSRTGIPRVVTGLRDAPEASGDPSPSGDYDEMLAIPIMCDGRTQTVVTFYR